MSKKLAPMKATTRQLMDRLPRDYAEIGDFAILATEDKIYFDEQKAGKRPVQSFEISRRVFDKLVRWYVTGSKCGRLV